jgi:hypothetical protein
LALSERSQRLAQESEGNVTKWKSGYRTGYNYDISGDYINLFSSDEDGGWIADPDLFACSAFGETPEDALRGC